MPVRPRWKRRSVSPFWSWYSCCAWPASQRCRCRFAVSTRPARRPGWPRVVTSDRPLRRHAGSRPPAPLCSCTGTADSSSRRSLPGRICYPCCTSRRPGCRRSNRRDERGSATVVAAAMVVVLLVVTGGSAYLGAAVVARHRAQAAADLAALAAAARVPAGPQTACAQANALARAMRVSTTGCTVDDLDVVVTVEVGWLSAGGVQRGPPPARARLKQWDRAGRRRRVRPVSATAARRVRRTSRARLPPG
jgi:secretion/DNA translocation related TadE-like protein